MKLILYSLETKQIHRCSCGQLGGYIGEGNRLRCSNCGKTYTLAEWADLPTETVPALTIPVVMKPEEGMR